VKRRSAKPQASVLSRKIRKILERTAVARATIDAGISGVVVDGDPIELGPKRGVTAEQARALYSEESR
jgi:hypothetical protein